MLSALDFPKGLVNNYDSQLERGIIDELSKDFITQSQEREPVLILVGGFQGAGKSSLIKRIKEVFDLNVISTDAIRQSLFRKIEISPEFSKHVSNIYTALAKKSLINTDTIIDANAHSKRIEEIENLLKSENFNQNTIKFFLKTSEETLKSRVRARQPTPGHYQGTEKDLEASLASAKINFDDYDLIVDTDKKNEDDVYKLVESFLSQRLKIR